ncbi:hypothetical protein BZG36_05493 [Bifiguratus adelaidae]|uniref:RRM domain-containing protein n=1 Tax=Bifiguratus adelaidae TaxID=1938954 RepID=A0A261XV15_9FUNG|nr:hypothetical protein BZG36_05493 [Bifiguratus adelaidae]
MQPSSFHQGRAGIAAEHTFLSSAPYQQLSAYHGTASPSRQLIVSNLPYRVRWQDLKDLFRKAGNILRADVALDGDNKSKGYGTVLFARPEDAQRAISMFRHRKWQGRTIEVREVHDPSQTYPHMLFSSAYTESPSLNAPVSVGMDNLTNSTYLLNSAMSPPLSMAQEQLSGMSTPSGRLQASYPRISNASDLSHPLFGLDANLGLLDQRANPAMLSRRLFVSNLPYSTQWQELKDLFRNAGNIQRADIAQGADGRSKGFATVLFATAADAMRALAIYDGFNFQGRRLRVSIDTTGIPSIPTPLHPPTSTSALSSIPTRYPSTFSSHNFAALSNSSSPRIRQSDLPAHLGSGPLDEINFSNYPRYGPELPLGIRSTLSGQSSLSMTSSLSSITARSFTDSPFDASSSRGTNTPSNRQYQLPPLRSPLSPSPDHPGWEFSPFDDPQHTASTSHRSPHIVSYNEYQDDDIQFEQLSSSISLLGLNDHNQKQQGNALFQGQPFYNKDYNARLP